MCDTKNVNSDCVLQRQLDFCWWPFLKLRLKSLFFSSIEQTLNISTAMPPKRKPEVVPEPSPAPKKRSGSRSAPVSENKKRARDEVQDVSSKGRRKKKVVEEEEVEEEEAPLTPIVSTVSKAKRGSKLVPTTPPTKGKATPPPSMPKSALKTTNSKPRSRSVFI